VVAVQLLPDVSVIGEQLETPVGPLALTVQDVVVQLLPAIAAVLLQVCTATFDVVTAGGQEIVVQLLPTALACAAQDATA